MIWFTRHAATIEAAAAVVTALVAVAALIGVSIQLQEAERLRTTQAARDAYRAHLALAVEQPHFAQPQDGCALLASKTAASYSAFVDLLLYSAEQMLDVTEGWDTTFEAQLEPHQDYLCSTSGPKGETDQVRRLLTRFRIAECPKEPTC